MRSLSESRIGSELVGTGGCFWVIFSRQFSISEEKMAVNVAVQNTEIPPPENSPPPEKSPPGKKSPIRKKVNNKE